VTRAAVAALVVLALALAAGLWWRWGEAVVLAQPAWFCFSR
jgi:hypothetical protein